MLPPSPPSGRNIPMFWTPQMKARGSSQIVVTFYHKLCNISGSCCDVVKAFALLPRYAAYVGNNPLPTYAMYYPRGTKTSSSTKQYEVTHQNTTIFVITPVIPKLIFHIMFHKLLVPKNSQFFFLQSYCY
jgi:hypothetical protein